MKKIQKYIKSTTLSALTNMAKAEIKEIQDKIQRLNVENKN